MRYEVLFVQVQNRKVHNIYFHSYTTSLMTGKSSAGKSCSEYFNSDQESHCSFSFIQESLYNSTELRWGKSFGTLLKAVIHNHISKNNKEEHINCEPDLENTFKHKCTAVPNTKSGHNNNV